MPPDPSKYLRPQLWSGPTTAPSRPASSLLMSGYAYLQLQRWRNNTSNEVAAYGLCHPQDPLYITDLILPWQYVSGAYCEPHEDHIAHLQYALSTERNIDPWRWSPHWFHTHPKGMAPSPSSTDTSTFNSTRYTSADSSFMAILGTISGEDSLSCRHRLHFRSSRFSPLIQQLTLLIDWSAFPPFPIDFSLFDAEQALLCTTTRPPSTHPSITELPPTHSPTPYYTSRSWDEADEAEWQARRSHSNPSTEELFEFSNTLSARPRGSTLEDIVRAWHKLSSRQELDLTTDQILTFTIGLLTTPSLARRLCYLYPDLLSSDRKAVLTTFLDLLSLNPTTISSSPLYPLYSHLTLLHNWATNSSPRGFQTQTSISSRPYTPSELVLWSNQTTSPLPPPPSNPLPPTDSLFDKSPTPPPSEPPTKDHFLSRGDPYDISKPATKIPPTNWSRKPK